MNINIIAAIRNDKKDRDGLAPICLYLYQGSKRISKISLGRKVHVDFWDNEARRVSKGHPNASLLNAFITKKISDLNVKVLEESIMSDDIDLKAILVRDVVKDMSFYTFAEKQTKEKNYAPETRRAYTVYISKLKAYKPYLKLSEINYQFLQGYENYLRNTLKNHNNTIWGNFKFINTMTNDAIKSKYLTVNPFDTFNRQKYKQTVRQFLNEAEINKIVDFAVKTDNASKRRVANYFLFMCYTGLRYSDTIRFNPDAHIHEGQRIVMETQKTKKVANLWINDRLKPLIEYIRETPLSMTGEAFNRILKEIGKEIGVTKKLSAHVARHSFGTYLASLGVPMAIAQGLLAHGSSQSTKIYYHVQQPSLDAAMMKFNK